MPINKYFGGHGEEVMADMKKRHGNKKGKSVFYATANKRGQNPEDQHGSLEDITYHEDAAESKYAINGTATHPLHKGYDCVVFGDIKGWPEDGDEPKGAEMSANRDNGYGIHYGAEVDYFGPDTDYRAEEIDPHQYGKDWEPFPFKDLYKTEDKQWERGFRVREQDEYDQSPTPGVVYEDNPGAEAYGSRNYQDVEKHRDVPDRRSFDSQREFARTNKDKKQEYVVDTGGLDTKRGRNIR